MTSDQPNGPQSAEQLARAEERYRTLFVNSLDAVLLTAPDGSILAANDAACQILGRSEAEICQIGRGGVVDTSDPRLAAALAERARTGKFRGELTLVRKDGTKFPGEVSTAVFTDQDGQLKTSMIIRDITERQRAESQREAALEALRESEQRFRMVLESSMDNLYRRNLKTNTYDYMSPAVERISGYSVEEMLSMPLESVVSMMHPDDIDRINRVMGESMTSDRAAYLLEYRFRHKDGQYRWLSDLFTVVRDAQGRPLYFVGNVRDITERKRAEEALRESEERFSLFMDYLPASVFIKDHESLLLYANRYTKDFYGTDNVLGRPAIEVLPKEIREAMIADDKRALSEGPVVRHELVTDCHGVEHAFETYKFPIRRENKPTLLGGIAIDITERKRAEEALQRSLEETARGQRLLLALSQAAQAVQRARTPEEVHHAVGDEVAKLGYHVAVLGLTDDQASLAISHMTFEPALVRAAEKLAGVSAPKFRLPLVPGSFLQRLMAEGGTIFAPTSEFIAKVLPAPLHLLATSLTALLGVRQSIAAPLQVGGKAHGLLVVNGTDLTEADVPAVTAFANQAAIAIENARLFEQVQAGREQLRRLADQIISAQEAERQRVSRELHDEAGQSLTALKVSLELLLADLPAEAEFLRQSLARTVDLTGKTMQHIRLLAHDLRPPALEAIGVNATLEDLCSDFAERTRLSIVYQGEEIPGLTDAASISLYRFLQEALTNVVKHADARQVHVTLSQGVGEACLAVADDGRGFDLSAALVDPRPKGLGLVAMRERIQMLGGRVEAKSWPGQGSRLVAHVPFKTFWKEKDR